MAPRTGTGCPHIGPFVGYGRPDLPSPGDACKTVKATLKTVTATLTTVKVKFKTVKVT